MSQHQHSRTFRLALILKGCLVSTSWAALDPSLPPSGNFDLSHWKLQLPTSNNILTGAGGSVDEKTPDQLVGFTNDYFYTASDGALVFWAPDNGATTSGSSHPRSELRERLNPNTDSTNWTVYGTHILTAQCKVLQVPSDTKKVCIGQMHEPNTKPDGSPSANNEQLIMFDLKNQKIYANINLDGDLSSTTSKTFIAGSSVALSNTINYTMSMVNGLLKIVVNNVTNSWDLLSGTNMNGHIAQNWDIASSNTLYFKAGSYNQTTNLCDCATSGAAVAFYALNIYHAPSITNQPASQGVIAGSNVTFSVGALGNPPMTYAWWWNGAPLSIATNTTFALPNVQLTNAGTYTVIVSDITGVITSSVATLTVGSRNIELSGNLDFGNVAVSSSTQETLRIGSTGNLDLHISSITYPAGFSGAWSGTVPAGGSQDVTVTFAPTAANSYGGILTVHSDAMSGSDTFPVSGTGVCTYSLSSTNATVGAGVSTNSFVVSVNNGCDWTAVSSTGWIHTTNSSSGNGTVSYIIDGNASTASRTGTITVAGHTHAVSQAGNAPPQVSLVPVSPITLPVSSVNLLATVIDDGAPSGMLQTVWSKVSGQGAVTFGNSSRASTTASFSTNGMYVLRLTASDGAFIMSNSVTIIVNKGPDIYLPLAVTNAVLQVAGLPIVLADEPTMFTIGSFDADGNPVNSQWNFGDGSTSTASQPSHTFTQCGPSTVSVTISDGLASTNASLRVVVPCLLRMAKLQAKLDFAKTSADSCTVQGALDLPSSYSFAGKLVILDVGGVEMAFTLDSTGAGQNGFNKFSKPKYNKTTALWTLKVTLKNGSWQTQWSNYGMVNSNIPKPGVSVALPAIVVIDDEAFAAEPQTSYTAKAGKSGTAK